jgi:hypothetical protein
MTYTSATITDRSVEQALINTSLFRLDRLELLNRLPIDCVDGLKGEQQQDFLRLWMPDPASAADVRFKSSASPSLEPKA